MYYDSLDSDPTLDHFEVAKEWSRKWFSEGQISQEIATWVVNLEPKPGVAFGNVKTHKRDNPLRLITSRCGTAIERLSIIDEKAKFGGSLKPMLWWKYRDDIFDIFGPRVYLS